MGLSNPLTLSRIQNTTGVSSWAMNNDGSVTVTVGAAAVGITGTGTQPVAANPGTNAGTFWSLTAPNGGNASVVNVAGGIGGGFTETSGQGGTSTVVGTGTNTGGIAGSFTLTAAVGGAASGGTVANVGGAGGTVNLNAGAGGAATGTAPTGGAGGPVNITAGNAGIGGNAAGGSIVATLGTGTGTGAQGIFQVTGGALNLAGTVAASTSISPAVHAVVQLINATISQPGSATNQAGIFNAPTISNAASFTGTVVCYRAIPQLTNTANSWTTLAGYNMNPVTVPANLSFANMGLLANDAATINGTLTTGWFGVNLVPPSAGSGTCAQVAGFYCRAVDGWDNRNTWAGFTGTIYQPLRIEGGQVYLAPNWTLTPAAGSVWDGLRFDPTATLTLAAAGASITQTNPGVSPFTVYQPTITSGTAYTVALASSFVVQAAPLQAGAGPVSITNTNVALLGTANDTVRNAIAGTTYGTIQLAAHTVTLTTTTGMTATPGIFGLRAGQLTINQSGGAVTVTEADTVFAIGIVTGASVTVTQNNIFRAGNPAAQSGTLTNLCGFAVDSLTRGTNNVAIWVQNPIQVGNATFNTTANQIHTATQGASSTQLFIGNASINVTSDARLKTDIVPTRIDALGTLGRLRVVDYTWNDPADRAVVNRNSRGRWVGMLAQEMIDVVPWVVNAPDRNCPTCRAGKPCEKHPNPWFVDLDQMAGLFVKAFQEVASRMHALEAKTA